MEPKSKNNNKELTHWCSELKKEVLMKSGQKFCKHCGKAVGQPKSSDKIVETETSEIAHLCSYHKKEIRLSSSLNFCKFCGEDLRKSIPLKNVVEVEIETSEPEKDKDQFIQKVGKSLSKTQEITEKLGIEVIEEVPDIKTSKITETPENEITHMCSYLQKEIQLSSSLKFCKYCGEKLLFEEKIEKMEEMELENVHWCSHYGKEIIVDSGLKFCKHCGKSLKEPETVVKEPLIKPVPSDPNELEQIEQTKISYTQSIGEEKDRGVKIQQKAIAEKTQYKEKEITKTFEPKPQPYIARKSFREKLGEAVQKRAELKTRDKNNEVEVSYIGGILIGLIIGALIGGFWQGFGQAIMIGQGVGAILGGLIGLGISQSKNKTENSGESQEKLSENPVAI